MKIYYRGFNGIRIFAALAVIISHVLPYGTTGSMGKMGVNIFFALSGFLISGLLLHEKQSVGSINIPHFYMRRILRIWPLYFLLIFLCFFVYPLFYKSAIENFDIGSEKWSVALTYYIFFVPNMYTAHLPFVAQLWSIGIEEQFYLFWPFVILLASSKRASAVSIFIIIAFFLNYLFQINNIANYFSSLAYIAVGCMAFLFQSNVSADSRLIPGAFVVMVITSVLFEEYNFYIGLIQSTIAAVFIANLKFFPILLKVLELRIISFFGSISYGLYMYHGIVIDSLFKIEKILNLNIDQPTLYLLKIFYVIIVTCTIATVSYFILERPLLKLKTRFAHIA